jgi:hypothetical protein
MEKTPLGTAESQNYPSSPAFVPLACKFFSIFLSVQFFVYHTNDPYQGSFGNNSYLKLTVKYCRPDLLQA